MRRARRWMWGGFAVGAVGFLLVSLDLLLDGPLQQADLLVNESINQEIADGEPLHLAGTIMSLPGEGIVVGCVVVLCSAWMLWRGAKALAAWCAGIGLATIGVIVTLKNFYDRARPPLPDPTLTTYSFPSGHTFAATATLGACILLTTEVILRHHPVRRKLVPLVWAAALVLWATLAAVTGMGRVLAQHHWMSDVIASWCLGMVLVSGILFALSKNARGGDPGPTVPETGKQAKSNDA